MLKSYNLNLIIDTDSGHATIVIPKTASADVGSDTIISVLKRVVNNIFVGSYKGKQLLKCDVFPLLIKYKCNKCNHVDVYFKPELGAEHRCSCGSTDCTETPLSK